AEFGLRGFEQFRVIGGKDVGVDSDGRFGRSRRDFSGAGGEHRKGGGQERGRNESCSRQSSPRGEPWAGGLDLTLPGLANSPRRRAPLLHLALLSGRHHFHWITSRPTAWFSCAAAVR